MGETMKKLLIVLLLGLLVSVLFTSAYQAQVSMLVGVEVTESPKAALIGCYQDQGVSIKAEKTTPVKSFTCCNNLPTNAKLEITSTHSLVQTVAPCCPTIVGGKCHEFNVVYDATGFAPGTYDVPFHVVADSDGLIVTFDFTVTVTVTVVEGG